MATSVSPSATRRAPASAVPSPVTSTTAGPPASGPVRLTRPASWSGSYRRVPAIASATAAPMSTVRPDGAVYRPASTIPSVSRASPASPIDPSDQTVPRDLVDRHRPADLVGDDQQR